MKRDAGTKEAGVGRGRTGEHGGYVPQEHLLRKVGRAVDFRKIYKNRKAAVQRG